MVVKKAWAELTVADPTPLAVGAKVMAKQPSGFSPLKFRPAEVTEVINGGVAYKVKTESGSEYTQSWDKVIKR